MYVEGGMKNEYSKAIAYMKINTYHTLQNKYINTSFFFSLTYTHTLTHSLTHSFTHSLTHTHTHTHTHSHIHTYTHTTTTTTTTCWLVLSLLAFKGTTRAANSETLQVIVCHFTYLYFFSCTLPPSCHTLYIYVCCESCLRLINNFLHRFFFATQTQQKPTIDRPKGIYRYCSL